MNETRNSPPNKFHRHRRLVAVVATILASLIAAAIGGAASAQSVEITEVGGSNADDVSTTLIAGQLEQNPDHSSPEDEALFEQFDQCLSDAGVDFEAFNGVGEVDESAVDAAFDKCDLILDGLSDDFGAMGFGGDLSDADIAILDGYEKCLSDAGLDDVAFDDDTLDDAAVDAIFADCDPILDDLSEAAQQLFGECDEYELSSSGA